MAITATFLSDFSDFKRGVDEASANLNTLKNIAATVAGAIGVSFSINAVVQFGKSIVDSASALVDLSTKTGASVEQLQRWASVGASAGVTTEQFADAAFKLGVALAGGEKGVVAAVGKLGIEWDKLRRLNPDQQFNQVVAALERMIDPQERNLLAIQLFGKSWAQIAPAVEKGYTDLAAAAQVSSDEQVRAIDAAADAWTNFVSKQKTAITSALGDIVLLRNAVAELPEGYATFLLQTDKSIHSVEDLDKKLIAAAGAHDIMLDAQTRVVGSTKEEQVAADKLAAAMVELNSVGVGWQGTLDTLDGTVAEAIKYYLEAGASQSDLAIAYGVTAAQVKAVATSLTEATKSAKLLDDVQEQMWKRSIDLLKEVRAQMEATSAGYLKLTNEAVLKELDAQTQLNKAVGLDAAGAYEVQSTASDKLRLALDALHLTKVEGISQAAQEQVLLNAYQQALLDEAKATDQVVPKTQAHATALEEVGQRANAASAAFQSYAANVWASAAAEEAAAAASRKLLTDAYAKAGFIASPGISGIPGRASGGPVSAGQPVIVGEKRAELFIPSTSGTILPSVGGGRGGDTHIYITQPLGTPAQIADIVKQALASSHMTGGGRMPA